MIVDGIDELHLEHRRLWHQMSDPVYSETAAPHTCELAPVADQLKSIKLRWEIGSLMRCWNYRWTTISHICSTDLSSELLVDLVIGTTLLWCPVLYTLEALPGHAYMSCTTRARHWFTSYHGNPAMRKYFLVITVSAKGNLSIGTWLYVLFMIWPNASSDASDTKMSCCICTCLSGMARRLLAYALALLYLLLERC